MNLGYTYIWRSKFNLLAIINIDKISLGSKLKLVGALVFTIFLHTCEIMDLGSRAREEKAGLSEMLSKVT